MPLHAIVFGSDQGLVGPFNEVVVEHAMARLEALHKQAQVWAFGDRVQARLTDAGLSPAGVFLVPGSVKLVTRLVEQILPTVMTPDGKLADRTEGETLVLFFKRPSAASCEAVNQRLLPLHDRWQRALAHRCGPTPRKCPRFLERAQRYGGPLSAGTCLCRCLAPAPSRSPARTRVDVLRCDAPIAESVSYSHSSASGSICFVRVASVKHFST